MSNLDEKIQKIDGPQFAQQRLTLIELATNKNSPLTPEQKEHLEGLIKLLDVIADYAHDTLGIPCLIQTDE